MLEFALGFLCALALMAVFLLLLRGVGHEAAKAMEEMMESEDFIKKKLPGGGKFKTPRPNNKKAQQIRIREGLMEGELEDAKSSGSKTRGRSSG